MIEPRDSQSAPTALPAPPADLIPLIEAWGNEVGQPTLRPTWGALKKRILDLGEDAELLWKRLALHLAPENRLLVILALSVSQTAARHLLLRQALQQIVGEPCQRILGTLFFFPPDEIRDNLAPLLYSKGILGQRAVYLMARLNLSLNPEAISTLLTTHGQDRLFLINLSHLVEPGLRLTVRQSLISDFPTTEAQQPLLEEFSGFLLDGPPSDPLSPDSQAPRPPTPQAEKGTESPAADVPFVSRESPEPGSVVSRPPSNASPTAFPEKPERGVPASDSPPAAFRPPPVPARSSVLDGEIFGFPKQVFWPALIGFSIGLLVIGLMVSGQTGDEPRLSTPLPQQTQAPEYWIDAVSRQRITQAFLKADSDFQMGEIFANRGDFSSALKLFQDALAQYPAHSGARFREGYCLMQMQDYKGAAAAFRKVLSQKPDFPQVNLFLGRIAIVNNEPDQAAQHFSKEFGLRKELRVGLEYCRLLNQLGRFPESISVLADLERRFPSDMIVSSMLTFAREQLKGKPR